MDLEFELIVTGQNKEFTTYSVLRKGLKVGKLLLDSDPYKIKTLSKMRLT